MLKLNIDFPSMSDPPPPKNMNPIKGQSPLHSVRGSYSFSVKPKKETNKPDGSLSDTYLNLLIPNMCLCSLRSTYYFFSN